MSSINKVIIVGRLGKDPDIRVTGTGNHVASFSVATSESWKDQQGQKQERTEWHRCVAWRKLAEIIGQYVRKGSLLYLEGKLQTRKWQDNNGQDRYTTEVVVDTMKMLGPKPQGQNASARDPNADFGAGVPDRNMQSFGPPQGGSVPATVDDDLPF